MARFGIKNLIILSLLSNFAWAQSQIHLPVVHGINFVSGYTTTALAAGTTALTNASTGQQYFTGSGTQNVHMPQTSTLGFGWQFTIVNMSTGVVTVESFGGNVIQAMAANSTLVVTAISQTIDTAAAWSALYSTAGGSITAPLSSLTNATGTNSLSNADNPQAWAWNTLTGSHVAMSISSSAAAGATVLSLQSSNINGPTPLVISSANDNAGHYGETISMPGGLASGLSVSIPTVGSTGDGIDVSVNSSGVAISASSANSPGDVILSAPTSGYGINIQESNPGSSVIGSIFSSNNNPSPLANMGTAIDFAVAITGPVNNTKIASIEGIATDVGASSYKGALVFLTSTNNANPTEKLRIDNKGHHVFSGTAPTLSSCGSGSIAGNDSAGRVTNSGSGCTLTFAGSWTNAPACSVRDETRSAAISGVATTTTLPLAGFTSGDSFTYICDGY